MKLDLIPVVGVGVRAIKTSYICVGDKDRCDASTRKALDGIHYFSPIIHGVNITLAKTDILKVLFVVIFCYFFPYQRLKSAEAVNDYRFKLIGFIKYRERFHHLIVSFKLRKGGHIKVSKAIFR